MDAGVLTLIGQVPLLTGVILGAVHGVVVGVMAADDAPDAFAAVRVSPSSSPVQRASAIRAMSAPVATRAGERVGLDVARC
jgi:hypothetical protein